MRNSDGNLNVPYAYENDDKVVVDFVDQKNTFTKGYLAMQHHDPGGSVRYRNLMMRTLPVKK